MKTSNPTPNKNEILTLILADMRNRKLVIDLDHIGAQALVDVGISAGTGYAVRLIVA